MDPRVTPEDVHDFRSKRGEWVKRFDAALRELFERRLSGQRRKGRRPDPAQSLSSLRVMNDSDTSSQRALADGIETPGGGGEAGARGARPSRIGSAGRAARSRGRQSVFAPPILLDAIGVTSRSLYPEARVWRPLMERVIGDFAPAVNKTYIQLNRFLTERGILLGIGPVLRARSDLRPADDRQLLPLFSCLLNEVKPTSRQAWRNLDLDAAKAAGYALAPLPVNPYAGLRGQPAAARGKRCRPFPAARPDDGIRAAPAGGAAAARPLAAQRSDDRVPARGATPPGIDAGISPLSTAFRGSTRQPRQCCRGKASGRRWMSSASCSTTHLSRPVDHASLSQAVRGVGSRLFSRPRWPIRSFFHRQPERCPTAARATGRRRHRRR